MCNWIQLIIISSLSFALSDGIYDFVVGKEKKGTLNYVQNLFVSAFICAVTGNGCLWLIWDADQDEMSKALNISILAGIFYFASHLLLLKSFESTPSTVLLPLLQAGTVFTLFGSIIKSWITGEAWLENYWHLLSYLLLLIGGLLPATQGNLLRAFSIKFWKQSNVIYPIFAEIFYSFYDLAISSIEANKESSFEMQLYMTAVTRTVFIICFLIFLPLRKKEMNDVVNLGYSRAFLFSAISEILTQLAFFVSAGAFMCYYQVSLVHAAEGSLIQCFNLIFSFCLKYYFNLGKSNSIQVIFI
ncbi:unnamed protein product [Blepharisma stoltei]|uniref:Uncharacterized protein n=1 Tax=Blepharisma stoltei TaxID=1481888 RepID=A0AAU9JJ29_9CILI|nr:unnamed protein product [Blepharisma stoltei]